MRDRQENILHLKQPQQQHNGIYINILLKIITTLNKSKRWPQSSWSKWKILRTQTVDHN